MAITKIPIAAFLQLAKTNLVLDVRSPSEYAYAHIPNAKNLPLFNDEERKIVGTAYKQQSKQVAIKLGLDFFGTKMREMVEEVEGLVAGSLQFAKSSLQNEAYYPSLPPKNGTNCILINCWRGGMRSAGVAWLLDLYGFKVYTLVGGYKAYRNWVLQQFEIPYHFKIIGGYTGSGKTLLLDALAKENRATIDLEGLASHKGSALGALGQGKQPSQEMFENLLAEELKAKQQITDDGRQTTDNERQTTDDGQPTTDDGRQTTDDRQQIEENLSPTLKNEFLNLNETPLNVELSTLNFEPSALNCPLPIADCQLPTEGCIWLEDESQRIGNLQIPMPLWRTMRSSKVYFFNIPFEVRLNYLTEEYGIHKKDELVTAIMRIQKRLGGLETKTAINFLLENNFKESFRILLTYYDKHYLKGLHNRENAECLVNTIEADDVNANKNMELLNHVITYTNN